MTAAVEFAGNVTIAVENISWSLPRYTKAVSVLETLSLMVKNILDVSSVSVKLHPLGPNSSSESAIANTAAGRRKRSERSIAVGGEDAFYT